LLNRPIYQLLTLTTDFINISEQDGIGLLETFNVCLTVSYQAVIIVSENSQVPVLGTQKLELSSKSVSMSFIFAIRILHLYQI
jgi:hypothetical protein